MSLYPGSPRLDQGKQVLDDTALQDSMAKAIEDAMNQMSMQIKGVPLPATGRDDLRLLLVAISRGVLQYLRDHQSAITATSSGKGGKLVHAHAINLDVNLDRHDEHP